MDDNDLSDLTAALDQSPGLIVGIILLLTAIAVFSPAARAKIDYRLSQLLGSFAIVGIVLVCGWGFFTTYLG